ncbi:deSI-like protein At4g17486 isoform X2 [Amborella trichopoda]|uniref:deSI-like protein At4g17486 isoform X2 n=1 Tax=Amborella trichopoda TaxID=13333 RepID=UPI0009BDEC21|nr:deSI-like protein At4g17486 isoform X2 [Amborella trichopoda]|eukprot:XP_020528632.1 deSI-like protein At4g17486 isoform X2 [Amborella trichopoda]
MGSFLRSLAMKATVSSSAYNESDGDPAQLYLNIYDLTPVNDYLYWFGLGIYHSGIEIHGLEYGFGAHDFPTSGVFEVEPRNCPGFVYRCSILLGSIDMTPTDLREFMENMARKYHGDTYHLISKNCNHFTDDVCLRLAGKPIPGWVNRLARLDDGSESQSTSAMHDQVEIDERDQDKHLLPISNGEVCFIK